MPGRDITFVNNGIYHIFNRTIDKSKIFIDFSHADLFLELLNYYRSLQANIRFSHFQQSDSKIVEYHKKQISIKKYHQVEIYCFSIMPTHFHLLLKQNTTHGISHFMSQILNSFTRYYNIKYDRSGQLFFTPFRAVAVTTSEQCIHVSRYIHLNLYSAGLISDIKDLFHYPYSSMSRYLNTDEDELVEKTFLLNMFNNTPLRYKEFVMNNAEYQKSLERIKYTEKWI